MPARECPLCGETMRLKVSETVLRISGNPDRKQTVREWVCPECDYFEETGETGEEGA